MIKSVAGIYVVVCVVFGFRPSTDWLERQRKLKLCVDVQPTSSWKSIYNAQTSTVAVAVVAAAAAADDDVLCTRQSPHWRKETEPTDWVYVLRMSMNDCVTIARIALVWVDGAQQTVAIEMQCSHICRVANAVNVLLLLLLLPSLYTQQMMMINYNGGLMTF